MSDAFRFAKNRPKFADLKIINDNGLGYLIVHAGDVDDWLLLRWWVDGGIVAGELACRRGDAPFKIFEKPYIECVWEGVVTEFERDAWVRHIMAGSGHSEEYLSDQLATGRY